MAQKKTKALVVAGVEITQEILDSAANEINAAAVELAYVSNITKVEMFWEVGQILRRHESQHKVQISDLVAVTAHDNRVKEVHMSERNLWFAVKVYDTYTALNFKKAEEALPDGKATSITKLKKLLVKTDPKKVPTLDEIAAALFRKYGPTGCKEIVKVLQVLIKKGAQK